MTENELRERLRMLAPQSDTVAVMDEFRRLLRVEEQLEALQEVLEAARELNERSWTRIEQSRLSTAIARADSLGVEKNSTPSNPASAPEVQATPSGTQHRSGASAEGNEAVTGAEDSSPASSLNTPSVTPEAPGDSS